MMERTNNEIIDTIVPSPREQENLQQSHPVRATVYRVIFADESGSRNLNTFDTVLITLICLNVLAIMLESMEVIATAYRTELYLFEIFSVAVFTIEYFVRAWCVVEQPQGRYAHAVRGRLLYLMTPMALIDLLAVLPFYLAFLVAIDLRFLRVLRLLRVFKLTRYSSAMSILLSVIRQESKAFAAALFVLTLLIVMSASMIHVFEHEAQPEKFASIPHAMWWALITLTTVGYGDIVPITMGGKLFGAFISVIGIGMVALPAGILASGFSEKLHARRRDYEAKVEHALEDGVISAVEIEALREEQSSSGLSDEDARAILRRLITSRRGRIMSCPNCGHVLHMDANSTE
jgi:voltage-gated potassium channel